MIYAPKHHRAASDGMVYEHILVAEEMLGRLLKDKEVVHHIDENRDNNSYENLIVFKNVAEHTRFHIYKRHNTSFILVQNNDGSTSVKKCTEQRINTVNNKPKFNLSKDELSELLNTYNYSQIARKYNVTPNAVKKKAKKYNLYSYCFNKPISKNEIIAVLEKSISLNQAAKTLNITYDILKRWINKYQITITPAFYLCVTTHEKFNTKTDIQRKYYPYMSTDYVYHLFKGIEENKEKKIHDKIWRFYTISAI